MRAALVPRVLGCCLALVSAVAADRPNVLLILADDLGYGDVRCYNPQAKVATPNLDRLAAEGMRFTDAHSPATVCTPSRYALLTGQMAFRVPNGGTVFQGAGGPSLIAPGRLTLPAMLRGQGYATAAVGKWHVGLTFRDMAGLPIHRGRLEDVGRIDYSRRIEGGPLDHGFEAGLACLDQLLGPFQHLQFPPRLGRRDVVGGRTFRLVHRGQPGPNTCRRRYRLHLRQQGNQYAVQVCRSTTVGSADTAHLVPNRR